MNNSAVSSEVIDRQISQLFEQYDSNKDGKLSRQDLTHFLEDTLQEMGKRAVTREDVFDFLLGHDLNKDGEISPLEFKTLVNNILNKSKVK